MGGEYIKFQVDAKKRIPQRSTATERAGNSKEVTIKNRRLSITVPQPSRQFDPIPQSRKCTPFVDVSCSPLATPVRCQLKQTYMRGKKE